MPSLRGSCSKESQLQVLQEGHGRSGHKRQRQGQMHNLSNTVHCSKRGHCVQVLVKRPSLLQGKISLHVDFLPTQENMTVYICVPQVYSKVVDDITNLVSN